jgi:GT2 family glycosyltransferase
MPAADATDDGVYAVVVVYGRAWDAAAPMPLLRRWLDGAFAAAGAPPLHRVLVWDNSSEPLDAPPPPTPIETVADRANGGTRAAYTAAATRAADAGVRWVLLLDQDTSPPDGFPAAIGRALAGPGAATAAALVPRVEHDGVLVSPAAILPNGRIVPHAPGAARPPAGAVPTAIASGALVRTDDLVSVLPIPEVFWLDYLDHWVFRQLHLRGRPILPVDCVIDHRLSVREPGTMSPVRFRNVLSAERRFVEDLSAQARRAWRLRLAARALRLVPRSPALAWLALRACVGRDA